MTEQSRRPLMHRRDFLRLSAGALMLAALPGCLWGCGSDQMQGASGASAAGEARDSGSDAGSDSGGSSAEFRTRNLQLFDTVVTLSACASSRVMDELEERCKFFHNAFSRTLKGCDVFWVNQAGTEEVEVAPETAEIIGMSLQVAKETNGLFDITIGAVSCLWDFTAGVKPSDRDIAKALSFVGYEGLQVSGTKVRKAHGGMKIDLGGIAKGYIADDLVSLLRDRGCESALLNLGGNVYVLGRKPDGSPWVIGVQDPNGSEEDLLATRETVDESVVTSGLYERYFVRDGVRYGHILDPRTGYPVKSDIASVSVVSADSLQGDWLSTYLFLLGRDAALHELRQRGLQGLVVDESGSVSVSEGASFTVEGGA